MWKPSDHAQMHNTREALWYLLFGLRWQSRLDAMRILHDGDAQCVNNLMHRLGVTQSWLSLDMTALKQAGLAVGRRDMHNWIRHG
jgi:predicted transcriptional regulator